MQTATVGVHPNVGRVYNTTIVSMIHRVGFSKCAMKQLLCCETMQVTYSTTITLLRLL
jgi:hypothetical protein